MKTAEKLAWLTKYAHTMHINVNDYRAYYETVADHFERPENEDVADWVKTECERTGQIVSVQVYPHTPIGFYRIVRPTLERAIDDAFLSVLSEDLGPEALAAGKAIGE
jgi:hypothetical protein